MITYNHKQIYIIAVNFTMQVIIIVKLYRQRAGYKMNVPRQKDYISFSTIAVILQHI